MSGTVEKVKERIVEEAVRRTSAKLDEDLWNALRSRSTLRLKKVVCSRIFFAVGEDISMQA